MKIDKDLFMYDLVAVTIVHNEAPYIAEWTDYHLLAGVDHFLIYDNGSDDNLKEVLKPYFEKNLVTLIDYPKKNRQLEAYNDSIRLFKFFCRYMAFIDVDEFIFPQDDKSIVEVVDEILNRDEYAAGLAINLHHFGSNNLDVADTKTGVLERFTQRANDDWAPDNGELKSGNAVIRTIADPRRIKLFADNPHNPVYFDDYHAVNENGKIVDGTFNFPVTDKKILINYYVTKSREEYLQKIHRRETVDLAPRNELEGFDANNRNEIVEEKILTYRDKLREEQIPKSGDMIKILAGRKRVNGGRMLKALTESLLPDFVKNNSKNYFMNTKNRSTYFNEMIKFYKKAPATFFDDKLVTFMTCQAVSAYLKRGYLDETTGKLFEEASLNAVCKIFMTNFSVDDMRLLAAELPNLLTLPYATTETLLSLCIGAIPRFKDEFRLKSDWRNFEEFTSLHRMLQAFQYSRQTSGVDHYL